MTSPLVSIAINHIPHPAVRILYNNRLYPHELTIFLFTAPPPSLSEVSPYFYMDNNLNGAYLSGRSLSSPFWGLHDLTNNDIIPHILQSIGMVIILVFIYSSFLPIPGHKDSGIFPVYIPEHYGKRNSQHLFDPYR